MQGGRRAGGVRSRPPPRAPRAGAAARPAQVPLEQRAEPAAALDRGRLPGRHHGGRARAERQDRAPRRPAPRHRQGGRPGAGGLARRGRRRARQEARRVAARRARRSTRTTATCRTTTSSTTSSTRPTCCRGSARARGARCWSRTSSGSHDLEKIAEQLPRRREGLRASRPGARSASSSRTARHRRAGASCCRATSPARIEAEATYPGQVRVCVIRETRASDYAK